MTYFTKLIFKRVKEQRRYFKEPLKYVREIKRKAEELLPKAKVFLFGSILTGKSTPSSDIDVLIVSPNLPNTQAEQAKIKTKIYQKIRFSSPFEIHLVTPKGYSWYKRFIDKKITV